MGIHWNYTLIRYSATHPSKYFLEVWLALLFCMKQSIRTCYRSCAKCYLDTKKLYMMRCFPLYKRELLSFLCDLVYLSLQGASDAQIFIFGLARTYGREIMNYLAIYLHWTLFCKASVIRCPTTSWHMHSKDSQES